MPATAIRAPLARARLGRVDDDRLAALAAAGDERAFEALYDRHHRALLGFCRHSLGSHEEAEDALQQTFLRAHRALRSHGPPDELRPWLFAIARNRCRSMLAARRADAPADEADEPAIDGLGPEVERRADLRALVADVRGLPEDQRSALVLAELADMPHAEIAAVIDVPVAKVKALVHQARSRLIAEREARETPCEQVREELSTARGGVLRRGPLRRHLRGCEPCRVYRAAIVEQRAALRLALPALPSAGLKAAVLGGAGGGGGAAAAAGLGAASGAGAGAGALTAASPVAKLVVAAALAAGAGGGAVAVSEVAKAPPRDAARPAAERAPAAPAAAPAPAATRLTTGDEAAPAVRGTTRRQTSAGATPRRGGRTDPPGRARRVRRGRIQNTAGGQGERGRAHAVGRERAAERHATAAERKAAKSRPAKTPPGLSRAPGRTRTTSTAAPRSTTRPERSPQAARKEPKAVAPPVPTPDPAGLAKGKRPADPPLP